MKAISLWNPHGALLVTGAKPFETRHWKTNIRGEILLHASARKLTSDDRLSLNNHEYQAGLQPLVGREIDFEANHYTRVDVAHLTFGALIGIGELFRCVAVEEMTAMDRRRARWFGDFGRGRYAWEFRNVRRFKTPIPFKGSQGFFNAWYDPKATELIEVTPPKTAPWSYCQKCLNNWAGGFVMENSACLNPDCDGTMIVV